MLERGMDQRAFAAYLGGSESKLSRLLTGETQMFTRELVEELEAKTGKSFAWLADLSDRPQDSDEQEAIELIRVIPRAERQRALAHLRVYKPQ